MMIQKNCPNLYLIKKRLESLKSSFENVDYFVPSLWLNPEKNDTSVVKVNPIDFFLYRFNEVERIHENSTKISSPKLCKNVFFIIPLLAKSEFNILKPL